MKESETWGGLVVYEGQIHNLGMEKLSNSVEGAVPRAYIYVSLVLEDFTTQYTWIWHYFLEWLGLIMTSPLLTIFYFLRSCAKVRILVNLRLKIVFLILVTTCHMAYTQNMPPPSKVQNLQKFGSNLYLQLFQADFSNQNPYLLIEL